MKILVAYYSKSGNTKKVAEEIAKRLEADLEEIKDLTDRSGIKGWLLAGRDGMNNKLTEIKTSKNPDDYDLVVIGTPVWGWNSTPAIRTYITNFKKQIKKAAIFTTSGGSTPEKTVASLETALEKKVACFEGWTVAELKINKYQEKLDKFVDEIIKS